MPEVETETTRGGSPAGFRVNPSTSGDFPSFLNIYKSTSCKSQVGIVWVDLDYLPFPRLHFDCT